MTHTHTRGENTERIGTGVKNLDQILRGGIPKGTVTAIGGPPGSGKTIFAQQIGFHNARAGATVLFFQTLSEPTAKRLRYLGQFDYYDPELLGTAVKFVDLSVILRSEGVQNVIALVTEHLKREKPAVVVIDSFKVFDDLVVSSETLRKFTYEMVVALMAWECTTFLLGEFSDADLQENPLFSVIDGVIITKQELVAGEQRRLLQVLKMRGTDHDRGFHPFRIARDGVSVFSPRATIQRVPDQLPSKGELLQTGNAALDALLGAGIPRGSSLLVAGTAGTGKTALGLEFLHRGATTFKERGLFISFEQTADRLRTAARGLGFDLEPAIAAGMIEIVFVPQTEILVEEHLLLIHERVKSLGARRVVIDSLSVFLHKVPSPEDVRDKVYQLATVIQMANAVGFFATDIPYGTSKLSRLGVEETVVDGIVLLSNETEADGRHRYLEVFKLRSTDHVRGRFPMSIASGGIVLDLSSLEETKK